MYIYHALSAHMIHINLNMILYTYVEHRPVKTIYIKYHVENKRARAHTHRHTDTHTRTHARTHALSHARTRARG